MKTEKFIQKTIVFMLPRLGEILFAALFAGVIGLGPRMMNVDGDLGRHLTLGNYILTSKTIPTTDIFSFTKFGDQLTPHEWLADVIFAIAHQALGLDGVVWITALVLAGSFWLVYRHSLSLSNMSLVAVVGCVAAAAASSLHWLTRPHIFTIMLTALWAMEMDRVRIGVNKTWFVFPFLMLIWVNLHGAFIAGFVIWAAYLAGMFLDQNQESRALSRVVFIGPVSFLVSLINPDGLGIWRTAFEFLGNQYLVSHTAEYLPPDFQNPAFWPFLGLIIVTIVVMSLSKIRLNYSHLFLVAGWSAMALYSARNIPLFAVIVVPVLCSQAAEITSGFNGKPIVNWFMKYQRKITMAEEQIHGGILAIATVMVSLALMISGYDLDFRGAGNQFSSRVFPVNAVNWIEENPPVGNGFNYFPWGGYLLYRLWPERLVFIDGQTDFYGEELTREYEKVISLDPEWQKVLDSYQIQWVLMPAESDFNRNLDQRADWEKVYSDQTARIYIRKQP
jgi:hypothetical protein